MFLTLPRSVGNYRQSFWMSDFWVGQWVSRVKSGQRSNPRYSTTKQRWAGLAQTSDHHTLLPQWGERSPGFGSIFIAISQKVKLDVSWRAMHFFVRKKSCVSSKNAGRKGKCSEMVLWMLLVPLSFSWSKVS